MTIRRAILTDRDALVDIWLRSVRATHTFLSEEDIQSLLPPARDYLTSDEPELWVLCSDSGAIMGFMGMSGNKIWDMNLGEWTQEAIDNGYRSRLIEEFQILGFVEQGWVTGPGGDPYGSVGIIVNCPIVFRFL